MTRFSATIYNNEFETSVDPEAELLRMLSEYTLHPVFEEYGNFAYVIEDEKHPDYGLMHFWGNFYNLSQVFDIVSNDTVFIERMTAAIHANQASFAYTKAKNARQAVIKTTMELRAIKYRNAQKQSDARIESRQIHFGMNFDD